MDRLRQDLRFALRVLWKDRAFALTTIATLALCLAANVAIFAVVDNVILKPLPFDHPESLVRIFNSYPGAGVSGSDNGVPDYYDRQRDMHALESIANFRQAGATITGPAGDAQRVLSLMATPSFFNVLRVQAYRGQVFTEEQGEIGHEKVVILSYGFWQRTYAGNDDALGKDLRIGGEPYKIVGVLPPGFRFLDPTVQFIRPAAYTAREKSDDSRHSNNWQQFGRLKPGATLAQAQSQLDGINKANFDRFPQWREILTNAKFRSDVVDFQSNLIGETKSTLTMLWGGAVFVLLIGCVNVANLVLVRATGRQRELATRHALGATFSRLARQSLTESVVLSSIGGAAGLALAWWGLKAAPFLGFDQLPSGSGIAIDGRVVAFTLALVALVAITVGLIPVLAMRRANIAQIVREEGRSGTQSRGARVARRVLVTSQVAFALMLLIGAGVLLASFERVLNIDPGFRAANVLSGTIAMPASRYANDDSIRSTTDRILEKVRAIPGVQSAGATTALPLGGSYSDSVILAEGYQMQKGESLISPTQASASDGYFEAMGVELLKGRFFTPDDTAGRPHALIIDETLAKRFWPNGDALGKRMFQPQDINNIMKQPPDDQMLTIVGIVPAMRIRGLVETGANKRVGAYFYPLRQSVSRQIFLAIRTTQSPESVTNAVRREVAQIDPEMPFYGVRTMEDRVSSSLIDRRTPTLLASGFATVALFLAAIGIYGVLAYQVSQRRREIGIRIALGAGSGSILGMVLREGGLIVGLGALFGIGGAFLVRQTVQSQLYETGAMDPRIVVSVAAMLGVVALAACLLPARRAAKTDPMIALTDQ